MQSSKERLELVSKIVIFLPIVIVLISVLFSSSDKRKVNLSERAGTSINPQIAQNKAKTTATAPNIDSTKLDLKGPYKCEYKDDKLQADISVKDRNVYIHYTQDNKTNTVLINGDCGYNWGEGTTQGTKMCGISQYLSLAEMFAGMGTDGMLSMIGQVGPSVPVNSQTITAISKSCVKKDVDSKLFTIPTNITFIEAQKP